MFCESGSIVKPSNDPAWADALQGLARGDFSRLEPLFSDGDECRIVEWYIAAR